MKIDSIDLFKLILLIIISGFVIYLILPKWSIYSPGSPYIIKYNKITGDSYLRRSKTIEGNTMNYWEKINKSRDVVSKIELSPVDYDPFKEWDQNN